MSPSSQTPQPTGLSSSKPSKMHWLKNLFSKSKPGPKLSSNLKDVNASAPALISGHGNAGLDVPAGSRANASLDLRAAVESTPAISTEAHEVHPSVGKQVASAAWKATKTAAKIAETVFDGTPFNILLPALNKMFEIIDQIIENKESIAQLLSPLIERLDIVKAFKDEQLKVAGIDPSVERFSRTLQNITAKLQNMHDEGLIERTWHHDQHPEDRDKIFQEIDEATKNLQLELHLATFKNVHKIIEHNELIRLNNASLRSDSSLVQGHIQ
ncbi:NACHT domain-containing protein [Mycena chlorophos]|uniref:NACHT domain-containing protein n=1 Tax=Mycena chlorophos TaxID=658473 RepID=A0A8H6S0Z5_MYCCL|nr:NACHT domain-containing protein [Mycena chlorophos]